MNPTVEFKHYRLTLILNPQLRAEVTLCIFKLLKILSLEVVCKIQLLFWCYLIDWPVEQLAPQITCRIVLGTNMHASAGQWVKEAEQDRHTDHSHFQSRG